jgi:hypothetical protein
MPVGGASELRVAPVGWEAGGIRNHASGMERGVLHVAPAG